MHIHRDASDVVVIVLYAVTHPISQVTENEQKYHSDKNMLDQVMTLHDFWAAQ